MGRMKELLEGHEEIAATRRTNMRRAIPNSTYTTPLIIRIMQRCGVQFEQVRRVYPSLPENYGQLFRPQSYAREEERPEEVSLVGDEISDEEAQQNRSLIHLVRDEETDGQA